MSEALLDLLLRLNIAASAAILLVATLRVPLRRLAGARAAYWLWLAVPASMLGLWLPASSSSGAGFVGSLLPSLATGFPAPLPTAVADPSSGGFAGLLLGGWILGAFVTAFWLAWRQRQFILSLGTLATDPDGTVRSEHARAPMVVGAWKTRLVIPKDFEARFGQHVRILMLCHERAHQQRGDARVNATALTWLCVNWFNPLMHWALGRLRFDQELACDAVALSQSGGARQQYANALLNVQLRADGASLAPLGFHWQSAHPLKERIIMLSRPSPSPVRYLFGIACALLVGLASVLLVSANLSRPAMAAGMGAAPASGHPPAPAKFTIDASDMETRQVLQLIAQKGGRNILVSEKVSGKITVRLQDMDWREALTVVAQSQGLVLRESGSITFVDVAP